MKFDTLTLEWHIDVDDVVNNSSLKAEDLSDEWQDNDLDKVLKEKSEDIYLYMYSAIKQGDPQEHARHLRFLVDTNERKKHAFMRAVIEHVRGAIETGMDREAYENEGKAWVSPKVQTILRSAGLYSTAPYSISRKKVSDWEDEKAE